MGSVKLIIILAVLVLAYSMPTPAQVAHVFVKNDSYQCWLDVQEIAHRHGRLYTEDEKNRIIHVGHYSSMGGDFTLMIRAVPDKNQKGEEGCRVDVALQGGGSLNDRNFEANAMNGN